MSSSSNGNTPIVEPKPQGDTPDLTLRALRQRIRQQEILAELGVNALQGASFDRLLGDTARFTAEGLRIEFCKVLEYISSENRFLVRAGVGWDPGLVGVASGLIHSDDSQIARSSSCSGYESRNCRSRHARRPPSA